MDKHYQTMQNVPKINSIAVGLELICIICVISYVIYLFVKTRNSAEESLMKINLQLESHNAEIIKRDEEKTISFLRFAKIIKSFGINILKLASSSTSFKPDK